MRSRLADLYRAHFDFAWRSLRHLGVAPAEIDDATQEVFVVLLRREDALPPGLPERAWIFGVARRIASRHHRGRGRRSRFEDAVAVEATGLGRPGSPAPSPELELDRHEAMALLDDFLDRLTPGQREVFVLAELEEMSGREIADLLDLNPNTVSSRLRSAREAFERRFIGLRAEYQRLHGHGRARRGGLALSLSRRGHAATPADRRRVGALLGLGGAELGGAELGDGWDMVEETCPLEPVSSNSLPSDPGSALDAGLRQVVAATTTSPLAVLSAAVGVALVAAVVIGPPRVRGADAPDHRARAEIASAGPGRAEERVEDRAAERVEGHAEGHAEGQDEGAGRDRGPGPSTESRASTPDRVRASDARGSTLDRSAPAVADAAWSEGAADEAARVGDVDLIAELRLVDAIRRALAEGASTRALTLADEHAARFPAGALARERDGLRCDALCRLGRVAEAEALAERLAATIDDRGAVDRFLAACRR